MIDRKFGTARHRPAGKWVRASHLTGVVGLRHRKANVIAFARAVEAAEREGLRYGLVLERQSRKAADDNAIAVYGIVQERKGLETVSSEWMLGYVPTDVSKEVCLDLIERKVPIAVELRYLVKGVGDYYEVKFNILGLPGNSPRSRAKPPA